jgi:hypothetical protein
MTLSIMTFSTRTLSIMTFSTRTLSILALSIILENTIYSIQETVCLACCIWCFFNIMLSIVMLNGVMLNGVAPKNVFVQKYVGVFSQTLWQTQTFISLSKKHPTFSVCLPNLSLCMHFLLTCLFVCLST